MASLAAALSAAPAGPLERYDPSFQVAGAEAYRRDVSAAEVHLLDTGHFALDERADEVAALTDDPLA